MKWSAGQAAAVTGGKVKAGDPGRTAKAISTDTRSIAMGDGFVALSGENFDGHNFVQAAAKKGAAWVMVEKGKAPAKTVGPTAVIEVDDTLDALGSLARAHRESFKLGVVAVTGSIGKSTTKEMIAAILSGKGRVLKNRGNLNNRIGLPHTLFRLNAGHDYAVLEMGCNMPGEIGELAKIAAPDVGLITRVAPVHLEGLGSVEGVARAKTEMLQEMGKDSTFVLNLDDPLIKKHVKSFKGRLIGFSEKPDTAFKGESLHLVDVEKDVVGGRPRIMYKIQRKKDGKKTGKAVEGFLWTLSRHNAVNALAACTAARAFNVPLAEAVERVRGYKALAGRGEVFRSRVGAFIMDDSYNSSPVAVAEALDTLAWWGGPVRKLAVLGDMLELGKEADRYHREMGEKAADTGLDYLVVKGNEAKKVADAAVKAGLPRDRAIVARDNREAAAILKKVVKKGDWVLVKGSRGMGLDKVSRELR